MFKRIANHYQDSKRSFQVFSVIAGVLLIVAAWKIYTDVFSPNVDLKYAHGNGFIYVHSDKNFNRFLSDISRSYVLINPDAFRRLAKVASLDEKLRPGRYQLTEDMNNWNIIKMLVKGHQTPLDVVFKYAERKPDISRFFATRLECDSNTLNLLLSDSVFAQKMGFDTTTIVCMFIPNTYNFYWNTKSLSVMERMHKEYNKFWTEARLAQAIHCGLTPVQVSILASIVQKESNMHDEMPVIAGVYLNRLRIKMPLQADPTLVYAWNNKSLRRVTHVHMSFASPYNTYINTGLPPGPICTPSIQAIDAVLNHASHKYLYFCAKDDFSGYHAFANTLEQHNQNARRYQRALNASGIR